MSYVLEHVVQKPAPRLSMAFAVNDDLDCGDIDFADFVAHHPGYEIEPIWDSIMLKIFQTAITGGSVVIGYPIPDDDEIIVVDIRTASLDDLTRFDHIHDVDGSCFKRRTGPRCGEDVLDFFK